MTLISSPVADGPADKNLIKFEDRQLSPDKPEISVSVSTDEIFYDGIQEYKNYNAGVYIVEVRAWAGNNFDTGYFQELKIEVVDPCMT